ncbi:MAG: glycosyltransferase family 4 protein [Chloroflexi bacterium]|nr:glycosyltransferase family 4 protein [Chloroflexota bacterium]
MNILFIHEVDWLKKVVFDIHSLAEILASLNHRVYAIDYEDKWRRNGFLDFGTLQTRESEGISRAIPGASVCLRHPGFIKIPGLSRMSAAGTHCAEIKKTIREKKIDVIVLYSVPTNGLQAVHLARKFRIPVVFRSIDILHELVLYPVLRPPTKFLEKRVYSQVDSVLAITPHHAQYVIKMGADPGKVKVLPFPIDTTIFHPSVDHSDVQQQWGFGPEDRVIVFVGTLFPFSGLDDFIRQFPRVVAAIPQARLLIVGDGPQRPKLERLMADMGLKERVIITGFQPFPTMPKYMNLAAVCINTFRNTPKTKDIFPGKVIQYIACGRATVATPLLGITSLVPGESGGILYANDAGDIADKVISLLTSPERRQKLGQAGVAYVREVHDQRKLGKALETELLKVVK